MPRSEPKMADNDGDDDDDYEDDDAEKPTNRLMYKSDLLSGLLVDEVMPSGRETFNDVSMT